MDIYVTSLPFKLKENELRAMFEEYGEVLSAKIIIDKRTRQSKGFGFVEMPNTMEARKAIQELNDAEVMGRKIVVAESVEKKEAKKKAKDTRDWYKNKKKKKPFISVHKLDD